MLKMDRFRAIGDSKKVLFPGKSVFYFFIKLFSHFFPKTDFLLLDHLF